MSVGVRSRVFVDALKGRRKRVVRGVAAFVALTLAATLSDVAALPERAVAKPKPTAKPACPDQRADRVSAQVTARLCNKRVEVTNENTETTQLWANPNGSLSVDVYSGPVRMRQGDRWVPIDLTLKKAPDGSVVAAAHPKGLRLSGAVGVGAHSLASVALDDDTLSMQWDGALPEPALAGNRATYPEALPGVDLVVEATRTGFEQFVVVKDASAAARVATLRLPMKSKKLRFANDAPGAFAIKDASGRSVGRIPTPTAWDASSDGTAGPRQEKPLSVTSRSRAGAKKPATASVPGAGVAAAATADAAEGTGEVELEISADPAWLADPQRKWPVTLDPVVDVDPSSDTYVKQNDSVDRSGANDLQMGKATTGVARAFLQWPTGQFAAGHINSATLHLWNWYSGSCTRANWEAWTVGAYSNPIFWGTQPAFLNQDGISAETWGFNTTCNDNWVGMDVRQFFQRAADSGTGTAYMGLKATDEVNVATSWKQFRSLQAAASSQIPYVTINYDAAPIVSNQQAAPTNGGCLSGSGRPYATSTTPQLRANVSDADTSALSVSFEWWVTGGSLIGST
ncbi:MAG: repeat-associated core protein, partial [Dactylosporangium sp.]|nr:repeat-associated core protein [Dactylosporangium sp.]